MVGCGNSKMSSQMYNSNFKNITNIDISDIVIGKRLKYHLEIICCDQRNVSRAVHSLEACNIEHGRDLYPYSHGNSDRSPDNISDYQGQQPFSLLLTPLADISDNTVDHEEKYHHISEVE